MAAGSANESACTLDFALFLDLEIILVQSVIPDLLVPAARQNTAASADAASVT